MPSSGLLNRFRVDAMEFQSVELHRLRRILEGKGDFFRIVAVFRGVAIVNNSNRANGLRLLIIDASAES
jgi:hypothetical protein